MPEFVYVGNGAVASGVGHVDVMANDAASVDDSHGKWDSGIGIEPVRVVLEGDRLNWRVGHCDRNLDLDDRVGTAGRVFGIGRDEGNDDEFSWPMGFDVPQGGDTDASPGARVIHDGGVTDHLAVSIRDDGS